MTQVAASAGRPGLRALFCAFFEIAISAFGGALPFARRSLVERRGWLTPQEFTETLSLCQSLPGPNIVNMSIVVGGRAAGVPGSIAAFSGLVGAPLLIVITAGALYNRFASVPEVRGALKGLGAAASGLLAATAFKMAEPMVRGRPLATAPFILVGFAAVVFLRIPLAYVLVAMAPVSIGLAWRLRRRT